MHEYLVEEIAVDCAQGLLTRREALRRLGLLGVGSASAAELLAACGRDAADESISSSAAVVSTDPLATVAPATGAPASAAPATAGPATAPAVRLSGAGEEIRFAGPNGDLIGVYAAAETPAGAVLVIHENRGLTPHIRSIPPRLAASGYSALAIDLLSEEGGTASLGDDSAATAALGAASEERLIADLKAGLDELAARAPGLKLAAIGFCFGGGMTWRLLASGEARLAAAVPFYGPTPEGADFSGSQAAVLAIYGELDSRVNASQEAARVALEAAGLTFELRTFAGVDHAFFNDTGARYNAAAATEAYDAMLSWFATHLA